MKKLILTLGFSLFAVACNSGGGGGGGGDAAPPTTTATTSLSGIDNSCLTGAQSGVICNNSIYGQNYGWAPYAQNYNLQNAYKNGVYRFCGCQPGTVPAYGTANGLGCVQANLVPNNAFQWSLGTGYNWAFAQASFNQNTYYNNYRSNYYGNYNRQYDPRPYGSGYYQRGFGGQGGYFRGGRYFAVGASWNNDGSRYAPNANNLVNLPQISNYTSTYNCTNSTVLQACVVGQNSCGNGGQCIPSTTNSGLGLCSNGGTGLNNLNNGGYQNGYVNGSGSGQGSITGGSR